MEGDWTKRQPFLGKGLVLLVQEIVHFWTSIRKCQSFFQLCSSLAFPLRTEGPTTDASVCPLTRCNWKSKWLQTSYSQMERSVWLVCILPHLKFYTSAWTIFFSSQISNLQSIEQNRKFITVFQSHILSGCLLNPLLWYVVLCLNIFSI